MSPMRSDIERMITEFTRPEALHRLFEERINAGDAAGLAELYEADAALVVHQEEVVPGRAAIKDFIERLLALKPKMRIRHLRTISAGDTAVLISDWVMEGTSGDGGRISDGGQTYDVVRRQDDGSWRFAVDNPWNKAKPEECRQLGHS